MEPLALTTLTSNPSSSLANLAEQDDSSSLAPLPPLTAPETYGGLPLTAWLKIGVFSILLVAFYRFNLARLWVKTNPINGQGNWEHAIFIPLIGIYYLYTHRSSLWSAERKSVADWIYRPVAPPQSAVGYYTPSLPGPPIERWTLPGLWALLCFPTSFLLSTLLVAIFWPGLFTAAKSFNSVLVVQNAAQAFPFVVAAVLACITAATVFVVVKGDDLRRSHVQLWFTNLWHGLGVWLMAAIVTGGVLFFASILVPPQFSVAFTILQAGVGLALVALLVVVILRSSSTPFRGWCDKFLARSSGWFGAFLMVWGILFSLWGIWPGQNDFFKDIGMVVSLFGLVLFSTNWRVMAIAWFPIIFLFCAIPWPDQVYSWVALPLQNLAAKVGVGTLHLFRVEAGQEGTIIWMKDAQGQLDQLSVEQACAGLKSLMTFVSIAAAIAFLSNRLLWQKLVIVFMAIPIAILCNTGRISVQGLLHRYASKEWSRDFAHGFVGLLLLIPGFLLIMGICWLVDHLFIEEADPKEEKKKVVAAAAASAPAGGLASPGMPALATAGAANPPAPVAAAATAPARTVIKIPKRPAATNPPAASTKASGALPLPPGEGGGEGAQVVATQSTVSSTTTRPSNTTSAVASTPTTNAPSPQPSPGGRGGQAPRPVAAPAAAKTVASAAKAPVAAKAPAAGKPATPAAVPTGPAVKKPAASAPAGSAPTATAKPAAAAPAKPPAAAPAPAAKPPVANPTQEAKQ